MIVALDSAAGPVPGSGVARSLPVGFIRGTNRSARRRRMDALGQPRSPVPPSAPAAIKYMARVEGALALALADVGITDKSVGNAIASAADRITAQEVADEESRTRHDVRALVNVIRAQVPDEARRFVHLGATSYDI